MVVDILQWTYRKYKVYCFIAYILLAICLLGYIALIIYWLQNLIQASKVRKEHPAAPQPEQLTASPTQVRTTEPLADKIMERDDQPVPKIRVPKPNRPPRRLEAVEASLTPLPLEQRARKRRKRRLPWSSRISDFDNKESEDKKWANPRRRQRLRLPPSGITTPRPPRRRGVGDRLKEDKPANKQYLFL